MKNKRRVPSQREACGGQIQQIDKNTYSCTHCHNTYYISTTTVKKVKIHIPVKTIAIRIAIAMAALITIALLIYQIYTASLVMNASRFSIAFRYFLLEVYDKPVLAINDEDFAKIKYLRIERIKSCYHFTYSFEDYNEEEFQSTIKTWTCQEYISNDPCDQAPDFSMLTGLTRIAMDEHMYQYSKSKFSKSANIRYVSCHSQSIDTRDIQEVVNPEKVEVLEYMLTQDIEGIKEFSNLKTLQIDVWFCSEFDISEIEQCQNLEKLVITERSTDFIGLKKSKNLKI